MKLIDLKNRIDAQIKAMPRCDDANVVIPIAGERSMGGRASVSVVNAGIGIDWDSGKFFLQPESEVFRTPQKKTETNPGKLLVRSLMR